MRKLKFIILTLSIIPISLWSQQVSNVEVQQNGNKIEVFYTLDKEADIFLSAVVDGNYITCKSVSGDIGINIPIGKHKIVWDVLSDVEKLIGEAYFEVNATQSTREQGQIASKRLKEQEIARQKAIRQEKLKDVHPIRGGEIAFGYPNIGATAYIGWNGNKPHRVGIFADLSFGLWTCLHKKNSNLWQTGFIFNVGPTITVSPNAFVFAGLGAAWQTEWYENPSTTPDFYPYTSFAKEKKYKQTIAAEIGVGGIVAGIFVISMHITYPLSLSVGVGVGVGVNR